MIDREVKADIEEARGRLLVWWEGEDKGWMVDD